MHLFEHQTSGAEWLATRQRGLLADTPGLGKTRTLLAAAKKIGVPAPLVFCPAMARTHWLREGKLLDMTPTVASYDGIVKGGIEMMQGVIRRSPQVLITDECHYLKHADAQRTRLVLGKDGYARRIPNVWAASGTPVPRHPGEFWTILSSLFPAVALDHGLRTPADFHARFLHTRLVFARGAMREKIIGMKNDAEFREILNTTMLRRTVDDVGLDVPEVFWSPWNIDAPAELDGMDAGALLQVASFKGDLNALAGEPHIARMRRRLGELKARVVLPELIAQLDDSEEKLVIFAHHTSVLHQLRDGLRRFGVVLIDGSVSETQRDIAWNRFQNDPQCRVFVGQNHACHISLTLTSSRRLIILEPDWAAYINFQLGQRLARIGSTFQRCVGQMVALAGTLDEGIVAQNVRETAMAQRMFA